MSTEKPPQLPNTKSLSVNAKSLHEPTDVEIKTETAQITLANQNPHAKRGRKNRQTICYNYVTVVNKYATDPNDFESPDTKNTHADGPYYSFKVYQSFNRKLKPWELEVIRQYNEISHSGFVVAEMPRMVYPFKEKEK